MVSELVSNAIRHAPPDPEGRIVLKLDVDDATARAAVIDGGRRFDFEHATFDPKKNDFLASHSWDDYAEWYLGLTDSATDARSPDTRSAMGTSVASIEAACLLVSTELPSGDTRRSSSPPIRSCSISTTPGPESRHGGPFVEALPRHPRCSPDLGARNEVAGQAGQVKSDFER
jgi:hypothetical protein